MKNEQLKRQREMLSAIKKSDSYLADLLEVTVSAYNKYKNGHTLLSQEKLYILNTEVELDFDFLFGNKELCTQVEKLTIKMKKFNKEELNYLISNFESQLQLFQKYEENRKK